MIEYPDVTDQCYGHSLTLLRTILMNTLSKFLAIAISSILLLAAASTAIADPSEEMRSLAITADYQPVNINEATASEIAGALRGVGLKTASAIVAYRKANGPFKTTQSLTAVKGIGNKTLLKNDGVIVLE